MSTQPPIQWVSDTPPSGVKYLEFKADCPSEPSAQGEGYVEFDLQIPHILSWFYIQTQLDIWNCFRQEKQFYQAINGPVSIINSE